MKFIGPGKSEPIADMGCFIRNPRAMSNGLKLFKKILFDICPSISPSISQSGKYPFLFHSKSP
jgi:hypothetical protein